MTSISIRTPAKLNLGLEIVRRRPDGYHDLVTIFQAVSLCDEFEVEPHHALMFHGDSRIPDDEDVARRTLLEIGGQRGWAGRIRLTKRIPISAGLGGGSSDAALILRLAALDEPSFETPRAARSIGADVPFFLRGGTALATGIGDRLEPLAMPPWWFVIVTPSVKIERKTAKLYAGLTGADFSHGSRVRALAAEIDGGGSELPAELPNAFERQMLEHADVARCWIILKELAGRVALSGAGPSLYSWHTDERGARQVADRVRERTRAPVFVARALGPHSDGAELRAFKQVLESRAGIGPKR